MNRLDAFTAHRTQPTRHENKDVGIQPAAVSTRPGCRHQQERPSFSDAETERIITNLQSSELWIKEAVAI